MKAENVRVYQKIVKSSGSKKFDVDERILVKLDQDKIFIDFRGNEIKIRENDGLSNTGIEHIAQAKHHFKEDDIDRFEEVFARLSIYIDTGYAKGRLYILRGSFGINNDMPYCICVVGNNKKDYGKFITAYPTTQDIVRKIKKKYKK